MRILKDGHGGNRERPAGREQKSIATPPRTPEYPALSDTGAISPAILDYVVLGTKKPCIVRLSIVKLLITPAHHCFIGSIST
jgi:hypothetical protein